MSPRLVLLFSLMGLTLAQALDGPEKGLADRVNYRPPMIGEKITKENQAWSNPLGSKKFEGSAGVDLKNANSTATSSFATKEFGGATFKTRSFLGIKNPWFGDKVYDTDKANVWSKNALDAKDKKFAVSDAQIKTYDQSGKEAALNGGVIDVKTAVEKGKAQGAVNEEQKKLTIDDVREILNKNR